MNTLFSPPILRDRLKNAFATVNGLERAERYVLQQEQLAGCRPLPLLASPGVSIVLRRGEGEGDEWTSSF